MVYAYTRNARRASKSLERPVPRSDRAVRIGETGTQPVEIKRVDVTGVPSGYVDVVVFNRQRHEHTQRVYLQNFERTGPSYHARQLLAATVPASLEFIAATDNDPHHWLRLEKLRCVVDLQRKVGVLVRINSQGRYIVVDHDPATPDADPPLRTTNTFATRKDAMEWVRTAGISYAYLQAVRWLPWDDAVDHNTATYEGDT